MDYLERKYKGKRKEKVITAIYLVLVMATIVSAGLLILGFLKKDIIKKEVFFFSTFVLAFLTCIMLIVKSKMRYKYERIVWLAMEAIVLLVLSIVSFLILV